MEIKNLFTPEAQQVGSQIAGVVRRAVKPLEKPIQDLGEQFTAKIQPAIQGIQETVNTGFVEPVMKPIERQGKITKVNKFLADKGITVDDIKNLAEVDGSDPEEALQFFRDNGIQIQGMEQVQPTQVQTIQQEGLADQFKMKSSEEFGVMEGAKDIGKFFINLPADSAEVVGSLYDAVTSPIDTVTGILKTGQGLSDKAVFGIANSISSALGGPTAKPTEQAQMVDAIYTDIKDKYGTAGKFKKAIVENPADTLLTLMGGLGVVKKAAQAKNLTNVVSNIEKVEQVINPVNILKKEAEIIPAIGTGIKKTGEALYKTAIKPSTAEAEKILQYKAGLGAKPTTVAETALGKGIAGTETRIGVQALKKADAIFKKEVNPILDKSTTEHNLTTLFKKAEKNIDSMKEGVLRKSELKEGLDALKEEYNSLGLQKLTTKALQQEKSSLDKFTPDKVFRGKPIASSYNEAKNILANVFRDEVHTDLGKFGLKSQEAFRDYANLKELSKVGIKGLTDAGFKGGFGGFWTTMYEQATTPIKTIGGQVLYKVGDKLEFLGPNGINKAGDYLKSKFSISKEGILTPKLNENGNYTMNRSSKGTPRNTKSAVSPNTKGITPKNAQSKVNQPVSGDTIPEGYFKNALGEIIKKPSNKKGGFIRNPFAKIEPKRLFAGENSAQPPKGKTGWFKGVDGKMRFEIDDSGAKLLYNDREPYTNDPITTLLDHKELYKQYPELKDVKVTIYSPMSKDADSISANYNSEKNLIMVNRNKINSPEGLKSSLLHEIQHAIQNKEGFARGGNMEMFTSDKNLQKLNTELSELISDKSKMSAIELKEAYGIKGVDHYINKIKDELSKFDETGKHGLYKRLGGEVEARNVQSRMGLTAKERTLKSPESTEDTPRIKQIIRKDNKGLSLSTKVPQNFIDTISKGVDKNGRIDLYNKTGSKVSINIKNTDAIEMAYENGHIYPYNTNIKTLGIKKKTP